MATIEAYHHVDGQRFGLRGECAWLTDHFNAKWQVAITNGYGYCHIKSEGVFVGSLALLDTRIRQVLPEKVGAVVASLPKNLIAPLGYFVYQGSNVSYYARWGTGGSTSIGVSATYITGGVCRVTWAAARPWISIVCETLTANSKVKTPELVEKICAGEWITLVEFWAKALETFAPE